VAVLGIDIGGSGIKGAPVDVRRGVLTTDRFRVATPTGGDPDGVLTCIGQVIEHFDRPTGLGITFPGVVQSGVIGTSVNLDKSWVGKDLPALVQERFRLQSAALNDADAAAVAEAAHGAAKGVKGVVIVLTFGTGVGSGLLVDGTLVPNTELGHLEMNGRDAEKRIAESVREKKKWSWKKWSSRANDYLAELEELFSPDLLVIGGGIAKAPEKWQPLLKTRAPLTVAALGNQAGIVGAAMAAHRANPGRKVAGAGSPRSSARRQSR